MFATSATHLVYRAAGGVIPPPAPDDARCVLCGGLAFDATPLDEWARPTFTDWRVMRSDSDLLCAACVWCSSEQNEVLTARTGRDKLQKMRNYSHIVDQDGIWHPLNKGEKRAMATLLLSQSGVPLVCVLSETGQKHLLFKARTNPPGQRAGWVLFEENLLWVRQDELASTLGLVEALYQAGHSKAAIESGQYNLRPDTDLDLWWRCEQALRPHRGAPAFTLALFLAQNNEETDGHLRDDSQSAVQHVAGDRPGLQTSVREDDLAAVRGPGAARGGDYEQFAFLFDED